MNSALYSVLDKGTTVDLTPFVALAGNTTNLLNGISYVFLHQSMPAAVEEAATDAVNAVTTALAKAQAALYIVLTASEYQVVQ